MLIELSPLLLALWLLGIPLLRALKRWRDERRRPVSAYLGETIPGRPDPML